MHNHSKREDDTTAHHDAKREDYIVAGLGIGPGESDASDCDDEAISAC